MLTGSLPDNSKKDNNPVMCTRFFIDNSEPELLPIIEEMQKAPLYGVFLQKQENAVVSAGEVFPTNVVPVIAPDMHGRRAVFPMKWGYRMRQGQLVVNARTETAASKPSFRNDWIRHRCIIPASYFFEWKHVKGQDNITGEKSRPEKSFAQHRDGYGDNTTGEKARPEKYMLRTEGSAVTWLCGLYRIEDGIPYFVVLTRDAVGDLLEIHDRMPLILPREKVDEWIDPGKVPEDIISECVNRIEIRAQTSGTFSNR